MIVQVGPEASTSLVHKLALMQESGELCDFTILVSGSEIKAHKCILAACCDYFKTSFRFVESSQSCTHTDLTHLGCEMKVVEKVIQSFYTNEIDLEPNCLESVLQLVDYFMCESLRLCIEVFMENTLTFHTAVMYFQLALQYRLDSTGLFHNAKWLMRFRCHDDFIYRPETLESSVDLISAYMTYDIFHHFSPLQLVEFMLNNLKNAVEKLHNSSRVHSNMDLTRAVHERVDGTFQKLSLLLDQVRPGILDRWKKRLVNYLKTWKESNLSDSGRFSDLLCHVKALELQLGDKELSTDCLGLKKEKCHECCEKPVISKSLNKKPKVGKNYGQVAACTNPNCQSKSNPAMKDPKIGFLWAHLDEFEPDNEEYMARDDYCACTPKPVKDYLITLEKTDPQIKVLLPQIKPEGFGVKRSLTIEHEPQTLSVTTRVGGHNIHWTPCDIRSAEEVKEIGDSSSNNADNSFIHHNPPSAAGSSKSVDQTASGESCPTIVSNLEDTDVRELQCQILVVLAPSADMSAQLMAIDDGQARPLLRSPKLELSYYNIEMNSWCRGCKLDLPIQGAMLEKHSWRIAYLDSCLYMFSLGREVGLQYNTIENKWTNLDCQHIFLRHGISAPVKSVIPIKVGRKLIVLSMSREAKADGTYRTQQHYFEMQPASGTFIPVASVQDDKMDVPITQWTVNGDILITVKASTMMYRNLSRIQYIHVYDAETRALETHEVVCTMEAGVKVLVRDQMIYLIDREGWCRSYDLRSSAWTSLQRYPFVGLSSPAGANSDESLYPALTRVTCHAGSSRWEITTSRKCVNARMQEIVVNSEGELSTISHPPPPFQFMTAMCPGTMVRSKLDSMEQPRFVHVDNRMMDFSLYSQMGGVVETFVEQKQ